MQLSLRAALFAVTLAIPSLAFAQTGSGWSIYFIDGEAQDARFAPVSYGELALGGGCAAPTGCGAPASCDGVAGTDFDAAACGDGTDTACGPRRKWFGGVEATFLAPTTRDTATFAAVTNGVDSVEVPNGTGTLEGIAVGPRVWVGFTNECGWGLMFRYWELNQVAGDYNDISPLDGDFIGWDEDPSLEAYAIDLEGVKAFCWGRWDLLASGGIRHGRLDQSDNYSAIVVGPGGDLAIANAMANSDFNGTGFVGGLQGTRLICEGECGAFELFASGRGGVLWGNSSIGAVAMASAQGLNANAFDVSGAFTDGDNDLWFGEFQLGVQWSKYLVCCRGRAFCRVAFEYQDWQGNSDGFAVAGAFATNGAVTAAALAEAGDPSARFIGATVGAGIMW